MLLAIRVPSFGTLLVEFQFDGPKWGLLPLPHIALQPLYPPVFEVCQSSIDAQVDTYTLQGKVNRIVRCAYVSPILPPKAGRLKN